MNKTYEATVTQTRQVVFTFDAEDIPEGWSPEDVAEDELPVINPFLWEDIDLDIQVRVLGSED
jgi:hypothetical protein